MIKVRFYAPAQVSGCTDVLHQVPRLRLGAGNVNDKSDSGAFPKAMHPLLQEAGLTGTGPVHHQLRPRQLIRQAVQRGEGQCSRTGVLVVQSGKYTGRLPNHRFLVNTPGVCAQVDWGSRNRPVSQAVFDRVHDKLKAYFQGKDVFVTDGIAGADPRYALPVRVVTEQAAQGLFMHHMLNRPARRQLSRFKPQLTVVSAPGLKLNPKADGVNGEAAILINLEKRLVLIAGTGYSGEMKKAVFSVMNYHLPTQDVLPLHGAAVVEKGTGRLALIVGLSGTGKTALATSDDYWFIGDDEIGWGKTGVFNIEGGSYASVNQLLPHLEPGIYQAVRAESLAENVVLDPASGELDFEDNRLAENTRVAYPLAHISSVIPSGRTRKQPSALVFLTCDASGVLPPVARLNSPQALAYFMNGYTSRLGGTEQGVTQPQAVFSPCFGAPFLPRSPLVYADMLARRLKAKPIPVYLVNTGWQGGPYGVGKRLGLPETRAILKAAINGSLDRQPFQTDPVFGFEVPRSCPGVSPQLLDPRQNWRDKTAYDVAARHLAALFEKNLKQYPSLRAGPGEV